MNNNKPLRRHVFSDAYTDYIHEKRANATGEKLYQLHCDCQDLGLDFEEVVKAQGLKVDIAVFLLKKAMDKRQRKIRKLLAG